MRPLVSSKSTIPVKSWLASDRAQREPLLTVYDFRDCLLGNVHSQIRLRGRLVDLINARKALNLSPTRLRVHSTTIRLLAVF